MIKSHDKWRIIFVLSIAFYVISILVVIYMAHSLPVYYEGEQKKEHDIVVNELKVAVENGEKARYDSLVKNHSVDFIVSRIKDDKIMYSSLNTEQLDIDFYKENNNVNKNVIADKENIILSDKDNVKYHVLLVEYYIAPTNIINVWAITLIICVTVMFSFLVLLTIILFYKYVKPVERLRNLVQDITAFQLQNIDKIKEDSEYDGIAKQLYDFSIKLNDAIDTTGYRYSELESQLLYENEISKYKNEMLALLSHDLKAPLSYLMLQFEQENSLIETSKKKKRINNKNILLISDLLNSINEINAIAYRENIDEFKVKSNFDLIQLLQESYVQFSSLFDAKDFEVEFEIDEKIEIRENRVRMKQLINNAFSNIYNHAPLNSEILISCYVENDKIILSFVNDLKKDALDSINESTGIFYGVTDYKYTSGLGLYTIKKIVKEMDAEFILNRIEEKFELKIIFRGE